MLTYHQKDSSYSHKDNWIRITQDIKSINEFLNNELKWLMLHKTILWIFMTVTVNFLVKLALGIENPLTDNKQDFYV